MNTYSVLKLWQICDFWFVFRYCTVLYDKTCNNDTRSIKEMFKGRLLKTMYIVDMSSLGAPWQNGPYKNQHAEQQKTRKTPRHNGHLEDFSFCISFLFVIS